MDITASGETLGARITGLDLAQPLSDSQRKGIEQALGRHGVVSFPGQTLTARNLRDFSANFGTLEINVAKIDIAIAQDGMCPLATKYCDDDDCRLAK